MRVLGLDVGSKTIGVAVTDELGVAAHPVKTLQRRGTARDVEQVRAIMRDNLARFLRVAA
jgi:putative Holliday junction resolvase